VFKRFLVMDLYFPTQQVKSSKWISVEDDLPNRDGIYKVRCAYEKEYLAYFCLDKCISLVKCLPIESTYWWDTLTKDPLYEVLHWGI
jgi:hypothetical protein